MTKRTEALLVVLSAAIAAAGTALVTVTTSAAITLDTLAAGATHTAAFGALLVGFRRWAPGASRLLLPLVGFITAVGSIEVFRIDPDLGRLQRWWLLLAASIGLLTLRFLRRRGIGALRRYRYLFLVGALALLALPLLPGGLPVGGATVNGARLWVRVAFGDRSLSFQPGEGAKVLIVVFLASYLADRRRALTEMPRSLGPVRLPEPRQLLPVLLGFAVAFLVLVYQRDLGASLLLFVVVVALLYAATGRGTYLASGAALIAGGAFAAVTSFSHVATRVDAWLHPFDDYATGGYQVAQGIFALAEGGLVGAGLGSGSPWLIPAAATDYVFVAIVEELGMAGGLALLAAFAMLIAVGFGIALRATDAFRSLLAAGLTIVLAVQTLLIIGGVLRMLPLTGITLPFVSYGGSSLLANVVVISLLGRISHEERT
ncbi:MAG: FtsW/RodA/SpoVE family cell cycle protein [Acidimicrobiia bacterium]|nr:FtsW/RodA/SpoVE family cell cycle protein [Acidimicrobiia bacterium]